MTRSLLFLTLTFTAVACAPQAEDQALLPDEVVAVEAAIASVQPLRGELPVEDVELEAMALDYVVEARDYANCELMGVMSGVWYDESLTPAFEGSWFQLGTGELGGTLTGAYGEGAFDGSFDGTNLGDIAGEYDDGLFLGDWAETDPDGSALSTGELIGRYERRNDYGGYFFGLWGRCD
jgi:hypothetical protein